MTDIKQAIAELREAINGGDNLKIGEAFRNLQLVTHETFPAIRLLGEIDLELFYCKPRRVETVWPILDRLESAVTGDVEYWDVEPGIIGDDVFTGSYSICKDPDSKDGEDWIWLEDKALADKICRAHNLAIGASPTPDLTARIEAAAEEIATKADEGWPALRCDKCGSLELIRNVPEDGYDCRGCSNFTRTPDEVIGITKIDLEKLATAIIRRHIQGGK